MNIIIIIIVLAIIAGAIYFALKKKPFASRHSLKTADLFKQSVQVQTTPKGMAIFGEAVTPDVLYGFDAGATKAFAVASECKGYTKQLNHADWSVFVLPSHPAPESKTPCYFHPFPNDARKSNSFIVAGEYLPTVKNNVIAVAQPNDQLQFAFEIVYNEQEHGLAHKNNQSDYEREGTPNHFHPLWSDCRTDTRQFRVAEFLKKEANLVCGHQSKKEAEKL